MACHRPITKPLSQPMMIVTYSVMKLKVNVQLASWATWNEFQGAHFFELKLRGPKSHALRGP